MNELLQSDEKEKALDILESNFHDCLKHLHRYITLTLVSSILYLALIIAPQRVEVPGFPLEVEGDFALVLLAAVYIAFGAMATYVAERANSIAIELALFRPKRFKALRLSPSIGTTDVPVVPFLVSFMPAAILSSHLAYLGFVSSNGGVAIVIVIYLSIGITLWQMLPVGKKAIDNVADKRTTAV